MSIDLPPHHLKIALLQPQIAPNTGNIARLCVATSTELHLVRPLGFVLSDRNLRRSAMDYWPRLKLTVHDDTTALFSRIGTGGFWLMSSKASHSLWDVTFTPDNWLVFGSETAGIPADLLVQYPHNSLRIPQSTGERCLNLATAAGIALFAALRQVTP